MVASLNQTTHVPIAAAKESTRQIKLIARLKTKRKFRKGASNTQKVRCHGKMQPCLSTTPMLGRIVVLMKAKHSLHGEEWGGINTFTLYLGNGGII